MLPLDVVTSPNFTRCSHAAVRVLIAVASQFKGSNNGNLCGAASVLRPHGLTSNDVRVRALRELEHYGLIEKVQQGGRGIGPDLYAVTWRRLDGCGGRFAEAPAPSCKWRTEVAPFVASTRMRREEKRVGRTARRFNEHRQTVQSANRLDRRAVFIEPGAGAENRKNAPAKHRQTVTSIDLHHRGAVPVVAAGGSY